MSCRAPVRLVAQPHACPDKPDALTKSYRSEAVNVQADVSGQDDKQDERRDDRSVDEDAARNDLIAQHTDRPQQYRRCGALDIHQRKPPVDLPRKVKRHAPGRVGAGRGDLAVAMGADSPEAPKIRAAAERISTAARRAGKPVMVFVGSNKDALAMREIGASAFIFSSDQGLMRQAAGRVLGEFEALV